MQNKSHVTQDEASGPKTDRKAILGGGVIQYHLLFRMAFKNLVFKKLRTSLTIVGVVIGIGAIVFLFSFGLGLQDLVSRQVIGSSSVQTIDVTTARSKVLKLDQDNLQKIEGIGNVSKTGSSYSTAGKIKQASSQTETVIFSADKTYVDLSALTFDSGKVFDEASANQVLINDALVKPLGLGSAKDAIDKTVTISFDVVNADGTKRTASKELKVTGVYQSDSRAEIFINSKLTTAEGIGDATQLKVVADNQEAVPTIRKAIESLGFVTASPLDTINQIDQVFTLLRLVLVGFGGIGMIIAILGMFNTLTISLLERTKEIGLMISLGARKQDVKRMFITEALLLSLLGGFFGVLGAVVFGIVGNVILSSYARSNGVAENIRVFIVSPALIAITLLLSGLIGLIVVYFPARRASQINPIDALHTE